MNIAKLAEHSAQRLGERRILQFENGEDYTNLQLLDYAQRLHAGFSELGLEKDKSAAMVMINHPIVYPVFQGIFRTGGTAIPLMFTNTARDLHYLFDDSQACGIITDESNLPKVREAVQGVPHIQWIVVLGGTNQPGNHPPEFALESLLKKAPQDGLPDIDDQDTALMLYTAGTTGKPKGVMLSHQALYHTAWASTKASELERFAHPRISVNVLPMAHVFGVGDRKSHV